jgi:hypothetical protein
MVCLQLILIWYACSCFSFNLNDVSIQLLLCNNFFHHYNFIGHMISGVVCLCTLHPISLFKPINFNLTIPCCPFVMVSFYAMLLLKIFIYTSCRISNLKLYIISQFLRDVNLECLFDTKIIRICFHTRDLHVEKIEIINFFLLHLITHAF